MVNTFGSIKISTDCCTSYSFLKIYILIVLFNYFSKLNHILLQEIPAKMSKIPYKLIWQLAIRQLAIRQYDNLDWHALHLQ